MKDGLRDPLVVNRYLLVQRKGEPHPAWRTAITSAKWGPAPSRMVECREAGCLARRVAVVLLTVVACGRGGLEHGAACVESREPVLAVGGRSLAHGVAPVTHEHDIDSNDVGELACLPTLGASPAQGPAHHPEDAFLAQQRHRLRLTKRFPGERDGRGGLGRGSALRLTAAP
jgi:hypothetical protein